MRVNWDGYTRYECYDIGVELEIKGCASRPGVDCVRFTSQKRDDGCTKSTETNNILLRCLRIGYEVRKSASWYRYGCLTGTLKDNLPIKSCQVIFRQSVWVTKNISYPRWNILKAV